MSHIYLDYAAATPVDEDVIAAMQPYYNDVFYNPSALYTGARTAKEALENARQSVARSIGARPSEVIFTAGGTESANLAIKGVMDAYPEGTCIVSAIEHDAVLRPAQQYRTTECKVNHKASVELAALEKLIDDNTVLISVMYANNEIGTVQPIKEIAGIVCAVRKKRRESGNKMPLYFHTDACQAPNYLDVHVARLGVDLMTLNGGKIYGPKQSGVLYCKAGIQLKSQIEGGGQEFNLRSGTENVAYAVGFAKALDTAIKHRSASVKAQSKLSTDFIKKLEKECHATLQGDKKKRLPNNVLVTFPDADNERVLFSLDEQGVWAAAGSACSASKDEVSHVLHAIGLNDAQARSSIRFSLGKQTTQKELDATVAALQSALNA